MFSKICTENVCGMVPSKLDTYTAEQSVVTQYAVYQLRKSIISIALLQCGLCLCPYMICLCGNCICDYPWFVLNRIHVAYSSASPHNVSGPNMACAVGVKSSKLTHVAMTGSVTEPALAQHSQAESVIMASSVLCPDSVNMVLYLKASQPTLWCLGGLNMDFI